MAVPGIEAEVRRAAKRHILFLPHAVRQMTRPDRMITTAEVESVALKGEVTEDYPGDPRGHSCLLLDSPLRRPIHVVCSPKAEFLAIITAYVPDDREWSAISGGGGDVECIYCKGRMKKSVAPFTADREGYHVLWDALPAWVCAQCGEAYFESPVVDGIERALAAIDRGTRGRAADARP